MWNIVDKRSDQVWMTAGTRAEAYEISREYNVLFAAEGLLFVVRKA